MNKFTFSLLIFAAVLSLAGCDKSPKWRPNMPDDGAVLCSVTKKGYVVENNSWGFNVNRRESFDSVCAEIMK